MKGNGSWARSLTAVCATLTVLAARVACADSATARWDPNPEGNLAGYRLYWGTQSRGGIVEPSEFRYTHEKTCPVMPAPETVVSSLTAGVRYYFSATAFDQNNLESVYSEEVAYMPGVGMCPRAPSDPAASALSGGRVRLSWTDNSDNESGFKIDRRQSGTTGWVRVATTGPGAVTHTDTGLALETTYYYKVKAYNTAGNSAYTDIAAATTGPALAEETALEPGSVWRYLKGFAEPVGWTRRDFDDSGWAAGPGPLGYGEAGLGTTLSDMRDRYTCVYLRRRFQVAANPAFVCELRIDVRYDDGFVMWLNGEELARVNAPGPAGVFVAHDAVATANAETSAVIRLTGADLPALAAENVLAVQLLNRSLSESSDCLFDAELACVRRPAPAAADADADNLPDAWEIAEFGTPARQGAAGDPDGDGRSNAEEYVAGTRPDDPTSVLGARILLYQGVPRVSFQTVPARGPGYEMVVRYYALQRSHSGARALWQAVPGLADIVGDGRVVVYDAAGGDGVYRVRSWLVEK
ncbi:MAG: fibronectin type III domain-containing protein [Kiritimatiellae bacterium]|nr:fibronectin type III domain-containing protein [Kiritimatiellia bacterium]